MPHALEPLRRLTHRASGNQPDRDIAGTIIDG